jgi:2'-5' RNA ligase
MARIRCFIGIDIGDEIRRKAAALQEQLMKHGAGVKWVDADAMHITLLFLGEVDDRDLLTVCRAVQSAAAREAPFALRVSGVGAFPTLRRPKVVWGGITDGADPLRRLYGRLEAKLQDAGLYRREEKGYTPHLTLGRMKSEADGLALAPELAKHLAWDGGRTMIGEVLVFSSEQRRGGPEYAVLARSELSGEES